MKEFPNGSTKASSYLMPGFLSQKFMVQDDKNKKKSMNNKTIKKRNLYDIERTLDINIEILRNYFKTTTSTMTLLNQDKEIIEKFEKIININKRKKELLQEIKEKKSKNLIQLQIKNLIQLQINLENKRKLEETVEKYKDSLFDNEDAVNNKDEYVKLFQKKFVEVEIYLKRITSDMSDLKKKKYYQNYKMDNFLLLNVNLNRKKQKIIDDISKYDNEKNNLKKENQKIKKEENIEHIKDEQNEIQIKNEEKNINKTNEIIEKKYEKNIEEKISKIEKLKKFLDKKINIDNLSSHNEIKIYSRKDNTNNINNDAMFKKVDIKKINVKKTNQDKKEIKNGKERDKSKLHNDLSKRMNSFMDLSSVLNDNSNINNNNNNIKISRMWGDVSAIAKKDDDV